MNLMNLMNLLFLLPLFILGLLLLCGAILFAAIFLIEFVIRGLGFGKPGRRFSWLPVR